MNQEELKQRLIELLDNLNFEYGEILADCYENNSKHDVPFGEFFAEKLIANGVTIRERGEWILEHGDYGKMICSSCKGQCPTEKKHDPYEDFQITDFYVESDFCPHCGADMRGGKDE